MSHCITAGRSGSMSARATGQQGVLAGLSQRRQPSPPAVAANCSQRLQRQQQQQQRVPRGWVVRQPSGQERQRWRPCGAAAVDAPPSGSVDIENLVYAGGQFTVEGLLLTPASPDTVYQVLTDYEALPRVFHNIEASAVRTCPDTGRKQVVQTCRWAFLVFSGTFANELNVVEEPVRRQLTFSLVQSAFMKEFLGSWDVRPLPEGGAEVRHRLSVTPVVSPPQRIGDLSKRIFRRQVVSILEDLQRELEARPQQGLQ